MGERHGQGDANNDNCNQQWNLALDAFGTVEQTNHYEKIRFYLNYFYVLNKTSQICVPLTNLDKCKCGTEIPWKVRSRIFTFSRCSSQYLHESDTENKVKKKVQTMYVKKKPLQLPTRPEKIKSQKKNLRPAIPGNSYR